MADLISPKSKDWLKKLHDGESVPDRLEKLKEALTNAQITTEKQSRAMHIIVMEESSGTQGNGGAKKRKSGKRVQFKVVREHDKFVILEVKV